MPYPYTDWNTYLAEKDQPRDQFAPLPDPMASFQMPTDQSINPQQIGQAIDFMYKLRAHQEASRAAASRYAAMQDFNRRRTALVTGGTPEEHATYQAFAESAPRLFADPFQAARALRYLRPPNPNLKPTYEEDKTTQRLMNAITTAEADERRAEADYLSKGGSLRMAPPEVTTRYRQAREATEAARNAHAEHLNTVQARIAGGTAPRLPSPMPAPALPQARSAAGPVAGSKGKLTKDQARVYMQTAKGNRALAEQLARNDGWTF